MTDQIVISNSAIQTFKDCRRKYWLKYVRRLKPKERETTGALALGTRVHAALEIYYQKIAAGMTTEDADIQDTWARLCDDDRMEIIAAGWDTEAFDKEAELGRIMLEGYVEWVESEGIDSDLEILSQEETLSSEMLDGRVLLVGKIDQRVRRKTDNTRLIRDFKTAAQFDTLAKTIPQNEQFLLYMVLEMLKLDEDSRVSGALVTALRKVKRTANSKPPFYMEFEVEHNIFELRNFYKRLIGEMTQIVQLHDDIENGADHQVVAYPTPTRDCSWKCEFSAGCQFFDDGSDVEAWVQNYFTEGSPYEYYGESDPTV